MLSIDNNSASKLSFICQNISVGLKPGSCRSQKSPIIVLITSQMIVQMILVG